MRESQLLTAWPATRPSRLDGRDNGCSDSCCRELKRNESESLNNVHRQNRIVFAGNQSIRKTCQRKQAGFACMHQKKKSDIPTFLFSFLHGSAARPSQAVSDEVGMRHELGFGAEVPKVRKVAKKAGLIPSHQSHRHWGNNVR